MKNTRVIGELAQSMIISEFIKADCSVSLPFGDSLRYDLIADINNNLYRVQCKNGRLEDDGTIEFAAYSSGNGIKKPRDYRGQIELFAVYCPDLNQSYLIPVEEVGKNEVKLRVHEPKNSQVKNIRWAKDYDFQLRLKEIMGS